jgi:hypothetical protein
MPLDRETIANLVERDLQRKEADRLLGELIKDNEFREVFINKIKEMKGISSSQAIC